MKKVITRRKKTHIFVTTWTSAYVCVSACVCKTQQATMLMCDGAQWELGQPVGVDNPRAEASPRGGAM